MALFLLGELAMPLHELTESAPGQAPLVDVVAFRQPLDIPFADEKSPDLPPVGPYHDLEIPMGNYRGMDLEPHFVRHCFLSVLMF